MAFAILYELQDLNVIGGAISGTDRANVSTADRNLARRYWNGGLNAWQTAPLYGLDPYAPSERICVINYGTLAEFVSLCHRIADAIGGDALYLHALADDMLGDSGHIEPYPPTP